MKKIRHKIYLLSKKLGKRFGFDLPYFITNGFWVLSAQFVNMACSFFMSIIFARYLSKEVFGEYQLFLSLLGIFALISFPGLNTSIVRSIAQGHDNSYVRAVDYSFKKSLLAIPVFLGTTLYFYLKNEYELALVFLISSFLFSFNYAFSKWAAYWKGKEKFKLLSKQQIIQSLVLNGALIVSVIFISDRLLLIGFCYIIINTLFNIIWHYKVKKTIIVKNVDDDCIPYGKYITKLNILSTIILYFDKIIIAYFDIELLAVYTIALKLFDMLKQLIKSFYSISAPRFAKQEISIQFYKIAFLIIIGVIFSLVLYWVSKPLIIYFYTIDYLESYELFKKLLFVMPLIFVSPLFANKANAQQDKKRIMRMFLLAPLLSISSSILVLGIFQNIELFILAKVYTIQIAYFLILIPLPKNGN